MDGFEQAQPDHGRRQARGDLRVGAHGTVAQVLDTIRRLHQGRGLAPVERHRHRFVLDLHAPLGWQAGNREVLQLHAIDRFRQGGDLARGELGVAAVRPLRHGQAQQQRHGVRALQRIEPGHGAASVLGVTGLAGPRIEQRPQPVRSLRGGGRRHPVLAEQAVADLELLAPLEAHVGRRLGKDVGVDEFVGGSRPRLHGLEGLGLRKIPRGRGDGGYALQVFGRQIVAPGGRGGCCGGDGMGRRRQYGD
ncbi:hypothetical protein D9M68_598750 [compost metagenome]